MSLLLQSILSACKHGDLGLKKRKEELNVSYDINILSKEIHESPGC